MNTLKAIACLLGLIVFSSCQVTPTAMPTPISPTPTLIPPTPTTSTIESLSAAIPRYAADGPYQVGRQDFVIPDPEEDINTYIFYPQHNSVPDVAHGPYPLVIFSAGLAGEQFVENVAPLLEPIASYGFVVITYDPRGETMEEYWAGAAYRPLDFQRMIDYAEQLTAPGGQLVGMIDTGRIAAIGLSSGGWTALMAGGAQMDLGWCAANPKLAERELYNCAQFVPHQKEIASMLGLESAPSGLWPPMHDPRVAALIALSPDGDIWGAEYEGVAVMKVPTLIMAGSADRINDPKLCAHPIYEHLGSKDKTLVMLEGAKHALSWDTYSEEIKHIMIAFLLAKLKDNPQAIQALLPENMNLPGVDYETTVTDTE